MENQFAVDYLSDILIVTLVLYQGVKYYPDFFIARIGYCDSFLLFIFEIFY